MLLLDTFRLDGKAREGEPQGTMFLFAGGIWGIDSFAESDC